MVTAVYIIYKRLGLLGLRTLPRLHNAYGVEKDDKCAR